MLTTVLLAIIIATLFVGSWLLLDVVRQQQRRSFDAVSRITGACGDTMEVRMDLRDGRAVRIRYWTDGCAVSQTALMAASRLARGRAPEEILDIGAVAVGREAGGIPAGHEHCAVLAVQTFHSAVDSYMAQMARVGRASASAGATE